MQNPGDSLWWYVEKDKKTGPVDVAELKRLLQAGKITPKTMLWREGLETWQPLEAIGDLADLKAAVPPPLPPKVEPDPLSYPLATRWPRFLARMFDVWWETMLVGLVLGMVLGRYSAPFVEWINRPGSETVLGLMCLPLALALDAAVYRIAGNTPGKALLGLKVTTLRGEPLTFDRYLNRNFSIWVYGLAFGFPLINLFTLVYQSRRLGKGHQASYDESSGNRVYARPAGWFRKTVFASAFVAIFIVFGALRSMGDQADRTAASFPTASYSWENPVTGLSMKVGPRWKHTTQRNEQGQEVYFFNERADRAAIVFGIETAERLTLRDYVRAFQKGTAAEMRFADGGRFLERDGRQAWQASGTMVQTEANRVRVQVVKSGNNYWRVVTVQAMPYDYSEAPAQELEAALWSTVR